MARDDFEKIIRSEIVSTLKPKPRLTVDQAADQYRFVSSKTGAVAGQWDTSNFEVARGLMRAFTDAETNKVSAMAATQIMKTSAAENLLMYHILFDPCPILYLSASKDLATRFVRDKVNPMIEESPKLLEAFGGLAAFKTRSSRNTDSRKEFPGGFLVIATAGSDNAVKQSAYRVVILDEIDGYDLSTGGDDFLSKAYGRTRSYQSNSLIYQASSPSISGSSLIEKQYNESDMRRAYIACPHCNHEQYLRWAQVDFDTNGYSCEECGSIWEDAERVRILTTPGAVIWRQTRQFDCCGQTQDPIRDRSWDESGMAICITCGARGVSAEHAGFHASSLYHPGQPIADLVDKFKAIKASGDKTKLRTFINEQLAETWQREELDTREIRPEDILKKRETRRFERVPDGAVLTAGADVQQDAIFVEVVAWRPDLESWSMEYHCVEGAARHRSTWAKVDEILRSERVTESGEPARILATCIDSGAFNSSVTEYTKDKGRRRIFAIKGSSETYSIDRAPIWPLRHSKGKGNVAVYSIGTMAAKDEIAEQLLIEEPGPGYIHVPADRPTEWFDEMTNEHLVIETRQGREVTRWKRKFAKAKTEALDCRVYARAAYEYLRRAGLVKGTLSSNALRALSDGDDAPSAPKKQRKKRRAQPKPPPSIL